MTGALSAASSSMGRHNFPTVFQNPNRHKTIQLGWSVFGIDLLPNARSNRNCCRLSLFI